VSPKPELRFNDHDTIETAQYLRLLILEMSATMLGQMAANYVLRRHRWDLIGLNV
jgi:hypothetical protein